MEYGSQYERRKFWEMCASRGPAEWSMKRETVEEVAEWADQMLAEWDKRWIAKENDLESREIKLILQAGSFCPDCGLPQFICPSGLTCENGHGHGF